MRFERRKIEFRSGGDPTAEAELLYKTSRPSEVEALLRNTNLDTLDDESRARLLIVWGLALSDIGDVLLAVEKLQEAADRTVRKPSALHFWAAFNLFVRQADFQSPDESLPALSRLRQLAA